MHFLARLLIAALSFSAPGLVEAQLTTTRVSVGSDGTPGNGNSSVPAISADGRWVAFESWASNLVAGDTNGFSDIFAHDRQTGTTTRVSVGPGGVQGDGLSYRSAISADGRWVAFDSGSSNLVPDDTNFLGDVFVHDLQTGTTTRVSVGPGGSQGNGTSWYSSISGDGRWVAFASYAGNLIAEDTNGYEDAFVHDRQTGTTTRVSVGAGGAPSNGPSYGPVVSVDGRWVAFYSAATNLVLDDTNGQPDVFVHDRLTTTTTRVSVATGGGQGNGTSLLPTISADGRWVAFTSEASNLVAGDTNGVRDVFVHDRDTGITTRVSVGPGGAEGNGVSLFSALSHDGRWVAFFSSASNLVANDTNARDDVFVHDRHTGTTTRVSVGPNGVQANSTSRYTAISAEGRWVAFDSAANNLVPNDTNGVQDVFVHDRGQAGCVDALEPTSAIVPGAGATGSVAVTAPATCAWTAVSSDPSWLTVTDGSPGFGNGTVSYSVASNPGGPRTGTLTIGGVTFTASQASEAVPASPTGLIAHSLAGNLVVLRWTLPPGGPAPTGFVLEGGVHPGEVLASVLTGSVASTFTFTAPTGSFYVRIHAMNGTIRSAASNEIQIHVNAPIAPSAPADLLGLVNGSTLALAWTNTYEGGAPTSLVLDVTGAIAASLPLGFAESFSFANVPAGTYTLAVRAQNAGGISPPSNAVTLTFSGACSGPPLTPANVLAYQVGNTVFVDWAPAASGPAPTGYVLNVTGSFVGSFVTGVRALSGTVGPGSYTLSVVATNDCGVSQGSVPQTIVVP